MSRGSASLRVLVVSSSDKGAAAIKEMASSMRFEAVRFVRDGGEAGRLLSSESFDIVIINAPLSDEPGHELAMSLSEAGTGMGVMLLVKEVINCHAVQALGYLNEKRLEIKLEEIRTVSSVC
jgi:DNA-binding response OmpR family regulator